MAPLLRTSKCGTTKWRSASRILPVPLQASRTWTLPTGQPLDCLGTVAAALGWESLAAGVQQPESPAPEGRDKGSPHSSTAWTLAWSQGLKLVEERGREVSLIEYIS